MCSGSSLAERDAKSEGNMATRPREYKNTTLKKKKILVMYLHNGMD